MRYLRIILCLLFIFPDISFAVKTFVVIQTFNAGELSPLMDSRSDQSKYIAGCRTLENFIPLIYGGAQRRPGLEFIATQKSSSAKGRLVPFEHSVDDVYILLFENQTIRVFKDGAQVTADEGTEDLSAFSGNIVAHWKLNDNTTTATVLDDDGNTHDGTLKNTTANVNTTIVHYRQGRDREFRSTGSILRRPR